MIAALVDPHSGPSGHLSPARRGRGSAAAMAATIIQLCFLSPVERGRGAERSEAEWGSTDFHSNSTSLFQESL